MAAAERGGEDGDFSSPPFKIALSPLDFMTYSYTFSSFFLLLAWGSP